MTAYTASYLDFSGLGAYAEVGESFFPGEDWQRGIKRVSRLLALWPKGIFCVWRGSSMVGDMTLWPINEAAVAKLESGELTDERIDSDCLPVQVQTAHPWWIMTVVIVVPPEKESRREIVRLLLNFLGSTTQANKPCRVYAHAVTNDGERFCRRTGFEFVFPAVPQLCLLAVQ